MKRLIITLMFITAFSINTKEQEPEPREVYIVGRFIITHTYQGYQAQTGEQISPYRKTMFTAIKYLQK